MIFLSQECVICVLKVFASLKVQSILFLFHNAKAVKYLEMSIGAELSVSLMNAPKSLRGFSWYIENVYPLCKYWFLLARFQPVKNPKISDLK